MDLKDMYPEEETQLDKIMTLARNNQLLILKGANAILFLIFIILAIIGLVSSV